MTSTATLVSQNEAWGFFGTIQHHVDPAQAWPLAMQAIADVTGCPDMAVRDFLDSRHGRHFADDVANGLFQGLPPRTAIDAAVTRWMDWTVSRHIEREVGIPRGLPYLTDFVTNCEILAEAAA